MADIVGKTFPIRLFIVIGTFLGILFGVVFFAKTILDPSYDRPAEIIDVGDISFLLDPETHIRDKSILIFFDEKKGWGALSTRSTVNGCDLTYLDTTLFCPCSRTYYYHNGEVAKGDAIHPLPFYKVYYERYEKSGTKVYKPRHLLVNTGEPVNRNERFAPPGILDVVPKIRELNRLKGVGVAMKVPDILKGKGDEEPGQMFVNDENYIVDYGDFNKK